MGGEERDRPGKLQVGRPVPSCNPRQAAKETAAGMGKLLCLCLEKIRKVQ